MTTFPHPFTRIQLSGGLFGIEQWSMNLSVASGQTAGSAPTQGQADAVRDAFKARFLGGVTASPMGNQATLFQVKLARIGVNGLYVDPQPTVSVQPVSGSAGGGGTSPYPAQISLAVTLEGASPRARAGRGRIYLPGPTAVIGGDGRISAADATKAANAVAAFINDVNTALPGSVIVMGPDTAKSSGDSQVVARVGCGRVLDTIRARRADLAEERVYTATTIVDGGATP